LPAFNFLYMQVDASFQYAKVYDINKMDVVKGQKFDLNTDYNGTSKWFSDNDPVLELKVTGNDAEATAMGIGTSTVLIMDQNKTVIKELTISVVDSIAPMATSLGLTADTPVKK
jgi:hypothetical protein